MHWRNNTYAKRFQERLKALKARYRELPYPEGASIVYFHGQPKPDNCRSKWVREAWDGPS